MSRIEWSADGAVLLARLDRKLRVLDPATLAVRATIDDVLDARCPTRQIVAVHAGGELCRFDLAGQRLETRSLFERDHMRYRAATLSRDGHRVVVDAGYSVYLYSAAGERLWTFDRYAVGIEYRDAIDRLSVALADDGKAIAVAIDTLRGKRTLTGHAWFAFELPSGATLAAGWRAAATSEPLCLALDLANRRLAVAAREPGGATEVIRLPRQAPVQNDPHARPTPAWRTRVRPTEDPPATTGDVVRAVALDRHGVLACFAVAPARLRVDYPSGESLWLDTGLADLVAIAFSDDSHAIACLASDGTVEVVPVP